MANNKTAPLYQQIYDDVKAAIESGSYREGEKIPSETELSEEYGVSRITVRRAVEDLCSDGYLTKRQGRGTFVGRPHLMRRLSQSKATRSFSEICVEAGVVPGAHLVERQIVPSRPGEQEFFGMGPDALLVYVRRVRTADGLAVCDENMFVPYDGGRGLLTAPLEDTSLFDAIEGATGRRPLEARDWNITAVKATTEQAPLLGISVGDALLRSIVTFVDADGAPVCMGRHYFVGSRYELSI